MNKNRRNYYRILRVQPDASFDVIKTNYRTLLQKLKMHPDLGGDEWNASLINLAYNTLRDAEKRSEYDTELLKEYNLRELGSGHLKPKVAGGQNHSDKNQRNYYRLLHVQTDSPAAIITSSYKTLVTKASQSERLVLDAAYRILGHAEKKALYDSLLEKIGHQAAVEHLNQSNTTGNKKQTTSSGENDQPEKDNHNSEARPQPEAAAENSIKQSGSKGRLYTQYQPVITQYCYFCKTPHNQSPCPEQAPLCKECNSPLFPPTDNFANQSRRDLNRVSSDGLLKVYADWPGPSRLDRICDLSPTGVRIQSKYLLEKGTVLKLDGENFKAVGEVSYTDTAGQDYLAGLRFLAVHFLSQKGQFFSSRI